MKKKYMMIYEDVKGRILSGEYEVGAQIPDEKRSARTLAVPA